MNKKLTQKYLPWLSVLLILAGYAGMYIGGTEYISPFISTPQDTIPVLQNWALDCFLEEQKRCYFWSDAVFALGLLGFHYYLFLFVFKVRRVRTIIALMALALLLDWAEGIFYFLASNNPENFTWTGVEGLQGMKLLAYVILYVCLAFLTTKRFFKYLAKRQELIKYFFKEYFTYYYPSLISIAVLLVLFNLMDQFDAIIIELTRPLNLVFFAFLFLSSIVKVWFMPYYLQFTDAFYGRLREKEYVKDADEESHIYVSSKNFRTVISRKGVFFPVRSILYPEALSEVKKDNKGTLPEDEVETEKKVDAVIRAILAKVRPLKPQENNNSTGSKTENIEYIANKFFHLIRRGLGLGFIIVLFNLQYDALKNMMNLSVPTAFATGIFGVAMSFLLYQIGQRAVDEGSRRNTLRGFIVSFALFLLAVVMTGIFASQEQLHYAMIAFIIATITSGFAYIFFTVFRFPKSKKLDRSTFETMNTSLMQQMLRIDNWQHGITGFLMILNTLVVPIMAICGVLYCLFGGDLSYLHTINPANFYLLYVSGIICLFAVGDRLLKLRTMRHVYSGKIKPNAVKRGEIDYEEHLHQQYSRSYASLWAGGVVAVALIALLISQENYHHELCYIPQTEEELPTMTLEDYTAAFLERHPEPQEPIYLIAAEGGGLRAAYWTMLIMEKMGQEVYDRTFLLSGASGGAIGQGIYTYMQAAEVQPNARAKVIDDLSNHNFLTTDLAGLLTRSALTTLIPHRLTKNYYDRHYFMEKGYFDVIEKYDASVQWDSAYQTPFFELWEKRNYDLPLLFVNTTRTEDGMRGVVHPLHPDEKILEPYVDVSSNFSNEYINYPDAIFLTNRFPVASPAARVESRGHFVDGGYFENTGLKTILHTLLNMRAQETAGNPVYQEFFNREIILLSIRNSKEAFINEQLKERSDYSAKDVNHIFSKSELGSVIGAAAGSGMTGLSNYYESIFHNEVLRDFLCVQEYNCFSLPHIINDELPYRAVLRGQIVNDDCGIQDFLNTINAETKSSLGLESGDAPNLLMPPLGRLMNKPTTEYMKKMLEHPTVKKELEKL